MLISIRVEKVFLPRNKWSKSNSVGEKKEIILELRPKMRLFSVQLGKKEKYTRKIYFHNYLSIIYDVFYWFWVIKLVTVQIHRLQ